MSGFDFALKGTKERRIYSSYSRKALEIKGGFHISGPQPINDEGGAPVWVAEKFDEHPDIDQIALSGEKGSVVWSRMKE